MARDLEHPAVGEGGDTDWSSLYRCRGDEVTSFRPVFTGDVFTDIGVDEDVRATVIVLQHPCALRVDGVKLIERILVAQVEHSRLLSVAEWVGNYKKFPLPELIDGAHFAANLAGLILAPSMAFDPVQRVASLSQSGVNLLLQRWVHHNSRAIIPTWQYQEVTSPEFDEADLMEEWCEDQVADGQSIQEVTVTAHEWLRSDSGNGETWQSLLQDPQKRSTVRKAMRARLQRISLG